jgi:hypothetical protein
VQSLVLKSSASFRKSAVYRGVYQHPQLLNTPEIGRLNDLADGKAAVRYVGYVEPIKERERLKSFPIITFWSTKSCAVSGTRFFSRKVLNQKYLLCVLRQFRPVRHGQRDTCVVRCLQLSDDSRGILRAYFLRPRGNGLRALLG